MLSPEYAPEPVLPPKKILVPVDLSETSLKAWALAQQIAGKVGASIEVLYVHEPGSDAADPVIPADNLSEAQKNSILSKVRQKLGQSVPLRFAEGFPNEEILIIASRQPRPDLIVMGTHGRTGPARLLLGSVAETLSRLSPIPILTVRSDWKPPRAILAPVNFTTYSLKGLTSAAKMAAALNARLDVLYVGSAPSAQEKAAFDKAAAALTALNSGREPGLVVRAGHPVQEIIEAAKAYDLLAIVAHHKSFLEEVTLGTTAERVIRHSPVPVLSLPA